MLLWKNQDFNTMGIIVEKTPIISKAKKRVEEYTVEGRNGVLTVDTGTYDTFNVTVECHCKETANLDAIKGYLDGYNKLSFDGSREYEAYVNSAIPFEKVLMFKRFQVSFLCQPIAEDINYTTVNNMASGATITTTGNTDTFPIFEITGTGDLSITVNNSTFYINDAANTYTLDCKNKVIYDSNDNNASSLMNGDFPSFTSGENTITYTGNITNFKVLYKNAYL